MTEDDFTGNALDVVCENAERIDLLLLDLCDERHGVVDLKDNGIVTRSVEKMSSGAQDFLDEIGDVVPFGSERHFSAWCQAVQRVSDALQSYGLRKKTLVLAPEWALTDENDRPTPTSFGLTAIQMNAKFLRYYDELENFGFQLVKMAPTLADSSHQWGVAAFHYDQETYEQLVAAVLAHVAESN